MAKIEYWASKGDKRVRVTKKVYDQLRKMGAQVIRQKPRKSK